MIELLLFIGFSGLLGGGILTVWRRGVTSRRFNVDPELSAPEPRKMLKGPPTAPMLEAPRKPIPREIQSELDSTTEWWDGEFHKALKASGAPVLAEIEGDIIVEKSAGGHVCVEYTLPGHTVLSGCTCSGCRVDN